MVKTEVKSALTICRGRRARLLAPRFVSAHAELVTSASVLSAHRLLTVYSLTESETIAVDGSLSFLFRKGTFSAGELINIMIELTNQLCLDLTLNCSANRAMIE
ncbi:hypothetical protein RRG08_003729 [Elysia crispata]|uniref:Uncharacterized protein n=1 Tax=Elysia crispata TaxID=231223 RepID=A0AAE1E5S6_9GAST|nr:hypothetical protein RRG08_003729 [Elysia crispata]